MRANRPSASMASARDRGSKASCSVSTSGLDRLSLSLGRQGLCETPKAWRGGSRCQEAGRSPADQVRQRAAIAALKRNIEHTAGSRWHSECGRSHPDCVHACRDKLVGPPVAGAEAASLAGYDRCLCAFLISATHQCASAYPDVADLRCLVRRREPGGDCGSPPWAARPPAMARAFAKPPFASPASGAHRPRTCRWRILEISAAVNAYTCRSVGAQRRVRRQCNCWKPVIRHHRAISRPCPSSLRF